MVGVRICVKSKLPEFEGLMPIKNSPIDPDITWLAFFQFHKPYDTIFDPNEHVIKSSRTTAYGTDLVQQTSARFTHKTIHVEIIRLRKREESRFGNNSRGEEPIPAGRPTHSRISNGNGVINKSRGSKKGPKLSMPPNESGSSASQVPISQPTRKRKRTTPAITVRTPLESPNGRRPREIRIPEVPRFPEEFLNGTLLAGPQELDHLNYAESIASQDSQDPDQIGVENPSYSDLKVRVLHQISKVPNADFLQMLRELRNLANGDQRYRWSRKAPMVGNMMFQAFNV